MIQPDFMTLLKYKEIPTPKWFSANQLPHQALKSEILLPEFHFKTPTSYLLLYSW